MLVVLLSEWARQGALFLFSVVGSCGIVAVDVLACVAEEQKGKRFLGM
jgi:hypothetical protein